MAGGAVSATQGHALGAPLLEVALMPLRFQVFFATLRADRVHVRAREGRVQVKPGMMVEVFITQEQLQQRVQALGAQITQDYQGQSILLVGILTGALVFLVDLMRAIELPVEIDCMALSSYGNASTSSGEVQILKDLAVPIEGKHVLLVEDIVDTGLTLHYLLETLQPRHPASLQICTLLAKETKRTKAITPRYVGFAVPDQFVVGYGIDYAQQYRQLPYIALLRTTQDAETDGP
jgi:hypoxanthine phosphoribosyltransferase